MNFDFSFNFNFAFGVEQKKKQLSFEEFCKNAGYPQPYPKQVEMFEFCLDDSDAPRMLLGTRGIGKTDYITICGVSYCIYLHPEREYLIVTKERDRGKQVVAECIECLKRNGITPANNSTTLLRLKNKRGKDPNIFTIPIRGRGFRGHHPYCVILEDPITPEDTSEQERKRVKSVYNEVAKLTSNILIIGQPVHRLDLYQELRGVINTMLVKHGEIPELDADLDGLRAAGVDERTIKASYYLELDDDDTLPLSSVKIVDYAAKRNAIFIDPAKEGADFTAFSIGGMNFNNLVVTGYCYRQPWYTLLKELSAFIVKYDVRAICVETNGIGEYIVLQLQKYIKEQTDKGELPRNNITVEGRNTTENKHAKIMKIAPFVVSGAVQMGRAKDVPPVYVRANNEYMQQVKNYCYNSSHDDAPDSMAMLAMWLNLIR